MFRGSQRLNLECREMPRVHQLIHIDYKQNRSPHRVLLTGGLRPPLVEPVPKANMHKIRKVISHMKPHIDLTGRYRKVLRVIRNVSHGG